MFDTHVGFKETIGSRGIMFDVFDMFDDDDVEVATLTALHIMFDDDGQRRGGSLPGRAANINRDYIAADQIRENLAHLIDRVCHEDLQAALVNHLWNKRGNDDIDESGA